MFVLLLDGFAPGEAGESVVGVAADRLRRSGHTVEVLDLHDEGFDAFMSEAERAAYHEQGENLVTEAQRHSVGLVRRADALLVCTPVHGGAIAPRVKSWFERVFIPGVSFTFTRRGRVTGALRNIRRVGMIAVDDRHDRESHGRTSSGRSILRGARLNAHRFCRTTYASAGPGDELTDVVEAALARW